MSTIRLRIARLAGPLLLGGTLLALAGCSFSPSTARNARGPAPAGHVEITRPASILPGQGYAWVPMPASTSAERDARVQDEQFRERLRLALDRALQDKGYRPVAGTEAAFLVAYRVGVRDLREVLPVQEDAGGTTRASAIKCTGGGCSQLVVRSDNGNPVLRLDASERTEGALLVEIVEISSLRVIWQALNSGTVGPGDGEQARLDAIAVQTLAGLPPYRPLPSQP